MKKKKKKKKKMMPRPDGWSMANRCHAEQQEELIGHGRPPKSAHL
jgi:hypothetical protein